MHSRLRGAALALLVAACAAPLGAQETPLPAPGSGSATLSPGDAVRVTIWREPDLSGDFPVDENGLVTFPLVGELAVTGFPARALRDTLQTLYRAHVVNPSIAITPIRRVHVLGEVQRPGLYGLDPTMTLAGAVALAGGATSNGDIRRVVLIREGQIEGERVSALERLDHVQIRSGDYVVVQQRSWFERNSTFLVTVVLSVTSIVVSILNAP